MTSVKLVLAALATTAMTLPFANAQNAAPEVELLDGSKGLQEFVLKPRGTLDGTFIHADKFAARLDGPGLHSINFFSNDLHSAEYVLRKAEEIDLTAAQRRQIIDIGAESQARLTRQRLENEGSDNRLDALLEEHPIDLDAALAELDRLLQTERGPKREQLATLISVRNVLSEEQVEKLAALREPLRIQFLERAAFIGDTELKGEE